ncbi:hypothetical protein [Phytohabitans aurantiacus]|uniref:hypothetical protein n=1 Tax=Phytohabitans aurantiacus TaxID=3016789 RepID=UPI0024907887|nr:hypothetical protein [Phytohabitans aurantiacus]
MEGSFRLRQIVGGIPHWAQVAVRAEPAEHDDVAVLDGILARRRREVYGPTAAVDSPADRRLVAEAVDGARYALRRRGDDATSYLVTVTQIVDAPVDTAVGDVKLAAVAATCQAIGVELKRPPLMGAGGAVFPEDQPGPG